MTKFLVKTVSKATADNTNFAGSIITGIYGKAEKLLKCEGHYWSNFDLLTAPMIQKYGYNRIQDAMRSWTFRNPENTQFWQTEVEIISVDC